MKRIACLAAMSIIVTSLATPANDEPQIDKKTGELMKKVGALYKGAKSLHCDATIDTTVENEGQEKREVKIKATFDWERPNRFAMRSQHVNDANAGLQMICDGKMLMTHAKRLKQYTEGKAPSELAGLSQAFMGYGQIATGMLFQNILADDPTDQLLDGVTKGEHLGVEKIGGKDAHHLKFTQENLDWELWVAADGDPFVLKAQGSQPTQAGGKAATVELYTNWKKNAEPAKDAFAIKSPDGSEKVTFIGARSPGKAKDKSKDG